MPDSRRIFFALWPDEAVARQFDEAGRCAHETLGGRRMRRETLHLTLAFVGSIATARLQALCDIAAAVRLPAFALHFGRLECLRRKKIAWAAADVPPGLHDLVRSLAAGMKAAGFRTEERPFAAHVTLLRHARCEKARDLPAGDLRIEWPVRDFVLVESDLQPEGANYRILGRWPLAQT
ncbi:MAG: hypothetical protein AMXMBFR31_30470 [Candidatus Desulfobacillus denitrificans]|uniref:RNA 2',3'-cyclic phosphodiesterase n=1 Tax=Candidatus Desulfobacillus denitrificans TaxID=2608985 RepID=A0A809R927_9PROT|nr:RNA 2',3'-cyclic phosphodiesterase [Rhodocyclaceae bacterium]BBO20825.1 2'-5' RNA ligase [Candidatus Desulfobacillus denitrificans]GIK44394.1 MAG: RNA 2',3'-cyclic phosphodiesterase [Betaproteobacteria bacterium]GJQ55373.1 MAG: RNA 2',3'-cyclic phosphodiesterase [Rhodocyclaceae bacterium]